ncbi:MAG: response regulator, partial [Anaerolineae bacterium]|nr:response regulator [Anaerolineae bacterium]
SPSAPAPDDQALDWRSQVRENLASLQTSGAAVVADVREAVGAAVELESVLTSRHGVALQVEDLPPGLLAAVHPTVLRQVLIMAIAELVRCASPGQLTLRATGQGSRVHIELACPAPATTPLPEGELVREMLASQGGSVGVCREGDRILVRLDVPSAGEVTVLVVDDNADSIHYYRRCTAGTRYRIVHASEGQAALRTAEETAPDVIVLDIMLPDTDGWDLLRLLHESPATRSVPIIVCSIVREEDLASALGAALCLPKPVRRQDLLQALDQALRPGPRAEQRAQARS